MIQAITVVNEDNEQLRLTLDDPWSTGICITNITGLGPPKATINSTDLASSDGSIYNSARASSRNIVFSFRLFEDPETKLVETTRLRTYRYFPIKKKVTLYVETDHRYAFIEGYVESNEPNYFEKETSQQISIVCPGSYFIAYDKQTDLNSVEAMFEFPFENNSLINPLINFGEIIKDIGIDYTYTGDVPSGVYITIHTTGPAKNLTIYNSMTNESMYLDTSKLKQILGSEDDDLIYGDDIYIDTMPGEKSIQLLRSGKYYNILGVLSKTSPWLMVDKGRNKFGFFAEQGQSNVSIGVQTTVLYEGM